MVKKTAAPQRLTLLVQPRTIFGKKLKKMRHEGLVPANIYGPEFKSSSITVNIKDFYKVYKVAKETGIVYINLEKQELPVLVKHLQKHPVTDAILHVDFRKIDLKKKIQTEVPVKAIGVSEAVSQKGGVLLTLSETLLVEALPENIPSTIEIEIAVIKEIGQELKVSDLVKQSTYEIKTPVEKVVLSVVAHKEESITPETTAAPPEVIGETPAEGAETPAEGAAPAAKNQPAGGPAPKEEPKKESKK